MKSWGRKREKWYRKGPKEDGSMPGKKEWKCTECGERRREEATEEKWLGLKARKDGFLE
jgi:hypothetical protein